MIDRLLKLRATLHMIVIVAILLVIIYGATDMLRAAIIGVLLASSIIDSKLYLRYKDIMPHSLQLILILGMVSEGMIAFVYMVNILGIGG
ncbi:MAG: hypothetical protein [aquatic viral metagenome]